MCGNWTANRQAVALPDVTTRGFSPSAPLKMERQTKIWTAIAPHHAPLRTSASVATWPYRGRGAPKVRCGPATVPEPRPPSLPSQFLSCATGHRIFRRPNVLRPIPGMQCSLLVRAARQYQAVRRLHRTPPPPPPPTDASEGKGPERRPQKRLGRRLEEVAKAVGGGYCRLQIPLKPALGVKGTVAGHRLGALEGGPPLFPIHPCPPPITVAPGDTAVRPRKRRVPYPSKR